MEEMCDLCGECTVKNRVAAYPAVTHSYFNNVCIILTIVNP